MYLLYLDDSGSADNANEQYPVLGGVAVFERQAYHLNKLLDGLVATHESQNPNAIELHASEIFRGKLPPWSKLKKPERVNVIKAVLTILSNDLYMWRIRLLSRFISSHIRITTQWSLLSKKYAIAST
jgi:hypothetical protein